MTNHGVVFPIVADRFLSPELAENLGLAIVEHMERPREGGGTEKVTLVTSDTGYPDNAIQEALRAVIPHCRFFIDGSGYGHVIQTRTSRMGQTLAHILP